MNTEYIRNMQTKYSGQNILDKILKTNLPFSSLHKGYGSIVDFKSSTSNMQISLNKKKINPNNSK